MQCSICACGAWMPACIHICACNRNTHARTSLLACLLQGPYCLMLHVHKQSIRY